MYNPFSQKDEGLEATIADLHKQLDALNGDQPEYAKTVDQLAKLYALRNTKVVDPNALITVVGNLAIAVIVIRFERENVVTTKLFSFLTKR